MEISYLQRGPGRIAYDVQGEGLLVICVPGMGDLRSAFRFLVPPLVEAGFRVATMDLRGHGDSDDGFPAYDGPAAGSDLLALVEHLNAGPAILIGDSIGAAAATWAAAEKPDAVAGLVLLGAFVRNPKANPLLENLMKVALVKPWGPAVWKVFYKSLYPGRKPADLKQHQANIAASMKKGDHWRSFVRTTRSSHAAVEARLPEVHTRTLVIMGEKDSDWPDAAAERVGDEAPLGGELIVVPNGGHYPMAEYPELVTPAIRTFVEKVVAGA